MAGALSIIYCIDKEAARVAGSRRGEPDRMDLDWIHAVVGGHDVPIHFV